MFYRFYFGTKIGSDSDLDVERKPVEQQTDVAVAEGTRRR